MKKSLFERKQGRRIYEGVEERKGKQEVMVLFAKNKIILKVNRQYSNKNSKGVGHLRDLEHYESKKTPSHKSKTLRIYQEC